MASPSPSQGSIPNYKPGPALSRQRRAVLLSLIVMPVAAYTFLKYRGVSDKREARQLEEEGRRNWIQAENGKMKGNPQIDVNRSGGGL